MKKAIVFGMLVLCCGLVYAADTTISILSVNSGTLNTGDKIIAKVKVYDADGNNDIRRAFLAWNDACNGADESFVDCVRTNTYTYQARYTCTLTVTPCMKYTVPVEVVVTNGSYETKREPLGTYNFQGSAFPNFGQEEPEQGPTKIYFGAKTIDDFTYEGDSKDVSRLSAQVRFYDRSRTTGYVKVTLQTPDREKFYVKCRKLNNHTVSGSGTDFEFDMDFNDCYIKHTYYEYNNGRRKSMKQVSYEDVSVNVDAVNKEISISSDIFEIKGLGGKYKDCWKEGIRNKCGTQYW